MSNKNGITAAIAALQALANAEDDNEGGLTFAETRKRMAYWRQYTGEARDIVRNLGPKVDEGIVACEKALSTLRGVKATIASARKHWIGPKVPPKTFQRPHQTR